LTMLQVYNTLTCMTDNKERFRSQWTPAKIKKHRQFYGLTQAQMSMEMEVRQQTISNWECGDFTPRKIYSRAIDDFFSAKEKEFKAQGRDCQP